MTRFRQEYETDRLKERTPQNAAKIVRLHSPIHETLAVSAVKRRA